MQVIFLYSGIIRDYVHCYRVWEPEHPLGVEGSNKPGGLEGVERVESFATETDLHGLQFVWPNHHLKERYSRN